MKNLGRILAAVVAVIQSCHARVIQLDVSDDVNVAIDIDTSNEPSSLRASSQPANTKSVVLTDYDIDLEYEIHRGREFGDGKYLNFSNIPYARPPVTGLRWAPPVAPKTDRTAVNEGLDEKRCAQFPAGWFPTAVKFLNDYGQAVKGKFSFDDTWKDHIGMDDYPNPDFSKFEGSEDCLVLDVQVPKSVWSNRKEKKVPVAVFIHGGGYVFGYKEQAGTALPLFRAAEKNQGGDFIYVSINYRLGAFGFIGGAKFAEEGGTPNVGFHDQRFALEWVQKYIHLFGGDKDSVTVMGQSAGASSILHHLTSYGGNESFKPPFKRAIIQSPAFLPEPDPNSITSVYNELKARNGKRDLKGLRGTQSFDLLVANIYMNHYSPYGLFKFNPSIDETFVPELPGRLLAEGKFHKGIDVMMGHTTLDGLLFTPPWLRSDEDLSDYLFNLFPYMGEENVTTINSATYYKIYPKEPSITKIDQVRDLLDDVAISCNNYYLTEAMLENNGGNVFRYLFKAQPAIHGADLPYLFYPNPPESPPDYVDPKIAGVMQSKWVNFIRTGNPNLAADNTKEWLSYEKGISPTKSRQVYDFGGTGNTPNVGSQYDPMFAIRHKCQFWQKEPFRYYLNEGWMSPHSQLREENPGNHFELV